MSLIAITWSTNNPISAFCPYNTIMLPLKTQQGLYRDVFKLVQVVYFYRFR
jgi:hypothetical protein